MGFDRITQSFTTDAAEAATVYFPLEGVICGFIESIRLVGLDGSAGLTITLEETGTAVLIDASSANPQTWYPRVVSTNIADGADLSSTGYEKIAVVDERIKVVVAGGGASTAGTIHITTS